MLITYVFSFVIFKLYWNRVFVVTQVDQYLLHEKFFSDKINLLWVFFIVALFTQQLKLN